MSNHALLQQLVHIIKNENNQKKLSEYLELLCVDNLDFLSASKILGIFLHQSIAQKNSVFVKLLLDFFIEKRSEIAEIPIELWVITSSMFTDNDIDFIMKSHKKDPMYYLTILICIVDDICTKILSCLMERKSFKKISKLSWLEFLENDIWETYQNAILRKSIQSIIDTLVMQKPDWILSSDASNVVPNKLPKVPCSDTALTSIYNTFTNFYCVDNNPTANAEKIIKHTYAVLGYKDKLNLLEQSTNLDDLDDLEIFRHYGPVNTQSKYRSDEESNCIDYGGCRMFLCNDFCNDEFVDEKLSTNDWYTGYCGCCGLSIPNKKWCLRLPLLCGGWKGCYCSPDCLKREAYVDDFTSIMISTILAQIETYGIYN